MARRKKQTQAFCLCGCGKTPKEKGSRYCVGHYARTEESRQIHRQLRKPKLINTTPCPCGCGKIPKAAKYCVGHHPRNEEMRQKQRETSIDWCNTEEGRREMKERWNREEFRQKHKEGLEKCREHLREERIMWFQNLDNKKMHSNIMSEVLRRPEMREYFKSDEFRAIFTTPEKRELYRQLTQQRWDDFTPEERDDWIRAIRMAQHIRPNKPETYLLNLLNSLFPNDYKYVGDGSFTLGGKNPDFMNCNGQKLLIELYGDYWHQGEDPQPRIDHFKEFGFSTLIIWEHELDNLELLNNKLINFHIGGESYR